MNSVQAVRVQDPKRPDSIYNYVLQLTPCPELFVYPVSLVLFRVSRQFGLSKNLLPFAPSMNSEVWVPALGGGTL